MNACTQDEEDASDRRLVLRLGIYRADRQHYMNMARGQGVPSFRGRAAPAIRD
jgi:hypothetical protein